MMEWRGLTIDGGADVSECGQYRYRLWRIWDSAPLAGFIMLNPSTADADVNDPTILRCMDFARRWECGGIMVVNLFALRSPHPKDLERHADPVGPENDAWVFGEGKCCRPLIAAWGAGGKLMARGARMQRLMRERGIALCHLGLTQDGYPKHPLARGKHRIPESQLPIQFGGLATHGARAR